MVSSSPEGTAPQNIRWGDGAWTCEEGCAVPHSSREGLRGVPSWGQGLDMHNTRLGLCPCWPG
jgi:hypothetical protein